MAVDPENPKDTLVLGPDTFPLAQDDPIAWSSDGTKLLLRSRLEDGPYPGLFVLHPDGSRTILRPGLPLPYIDSPNKAEVRPPYPTWGSFSPDGTEVAFASSGRERGPYIIDADGGKPRPLGRRCPRQKISGKLLELCGESSPEAAAWSPDGSQIAWSDVVEDSPGHLARVLSFVNPDGTGLREEVAPLPGGGGNLVWSPDGSRLAFRDRDPESPGQIFVINADGSGLRQVTHDGENHWPAWSPDGSRIAFVHNGRLATIAPDGTDLQTLIGVVTPRPDGPIAWNPLG